MVSRPGLVAEAAGGGGALEDEGALDGEAVALAGGAGAKAFWAVGSGAGGLRLWVSHVKKSKLRRSSWLRTQYPLRLMSPPNPKPGSTHGSPTFLSMHASIAGPMMSARAGEATTIAKSRAAAEGGRFTRAMLQRFEVALALPGARPPLPHFGLK